jgi:hypothetical protein
MNCPTSIASRCIIIICSDAERYLCGSILLSHEDVGKIADRLYENSIRAKVELSENIGKMVIIDIETGDYEVDKNGLQAAKRLNARLENTRLFGIRIGYNVAASFGGVMKRVNK